MPDKVCTYYIMKSSLIALAIGTFALGVAEFAMMGILSDVARDTGVSIVQAGHLISAYAAGVAVGAPGLILLRRMPLKRLMLLLSMFIVAGNCAAALSPDYYTLLISRFVAGLPHGAFFGAGAIVCTRLATTGAASAVAVMIGGMTVANVIGVPVATMVANLVSWRLTFGIAAFFGLLAFLGIRIYMPYLAPLPDTGMKGQFRFLRRPEPWLIYAGVFFGQASVYTYFSYIEPVMTTVAHFPQASMTWIMMVAGCGMVVGNIMAGRLSDRHPAALVTAVEALLAVGVMAAIYFCSSMKVPLVVLSFVATALLFGIGGPLQYLIVKYARGGEMLGGAGIQIAFNVSNACAAALGGAAINMGWGTASPALVGIPCAVIGSAALFILYSRTRHNDAPAH